MNTEYKIEVVPQHERKAYIQAQLQSSTEMMTSHDVYEGSAINLKVIRVPLSLPLFRMANGRTQADQASYVAEKNLPDDYFSSGEENDVVQAVQQRILRRISNESPESIASIFEELKRDKQTEPIMITQSGVVVNGNRRLMAMRALYQESPADVPSFDTVRCAVLPPLGAEEVDDIEVRLQMRPETKLSYSWVSEALKIEKKLESKKSEDAVARLMRKRPGEIKKVISALQYARIYLTEWKKRPADYSLVEGGQQFFGDIVARLRNKSGYLRDANLRLAWIMYDNRSSLGGRLYDYNKIVGEKAEEVLSQLVDRIELTVEDLPDEQNGGASADEFELEIDLYDEPADNKLTTVIDALDDETRRDEVFDQLRAVCQTILDAGRAKKLGNAALLAACDANTRLTELDLSGADPKTYDGILKQLDSIINRANELAAKIAEIKGSKESKIENE